MAMADPRPTHDLCGGMHGAPHAGPRPSGPASPTCSPATPCRAQWHASPRPAPAPALATLLPSRDFSSFVRACEKFGRENVAQIATEIEGKTEDDVRGYAKVRGDRRTDTWAPGLAGAGDGGQRRMHAPTCVRAAAVRTLLRARHAPAAAPEHGSADELPVGRQRGKMGCSSCIPSGPCARVPSSAACALCAAASATIGSCPSQPQEVHTACSNPMPGCSQASSPLPSPAPRATPRHAPRRAAPPPARVAPATTHAGVLAAVQGAERLGEDHQEH